jgi:YidC/Oxa1 family membrane protein insertase
VIPAANILQPIVDAANAVVLFLHDDAGLGWGPSIIVLTFITRIVILPLSIKQIRSMRALQVLQPQIKEIQEKHKGDRQRLQQELMKFYQREKINPFASCIPLLLQLPVFLSLFYLLRSSDFKMELHSGGGDAGWWFIPALDVKATGGVLLVLILLYVGSQLVAGLIMGARADRNQRLLMIGLPIVFVPIIIGFPAGLVLYWITTNVWTIGQQYVVNHMIPAPVAPTPEEVRAAQPPPPPPRKRKRRR